MLSCDQETDVNAGVFDAKSLNYISRPFLWSNTVAFLHAGAAPNARGDLGIASYVAGGGFNITPLVGIDDDINGVPPAWEISYLAPSTHGPVSNRWGDYLRVRPHSPDGITWIASAYTLQGGGTGTFAKPRYIVFGRERDEAGLKRFWAK